MKKKQVESLPKAVVNNNKLDYLTSINWPFSIEQYDFNLREDPYYLFIKGIYFFEQLRSNPNTHKFVQQFLIKKQKSNHWHFMLTIANIITHAINNEDKIKKMGFPFNDDYNAIFDALSIDVNKYNSDEKLQVEYKGIKEKPVIKLDTGYGILNWNYFYRQLYTGLLFDFYNLTEIKSLKECKTVDSYLSFISRTISHKMFEKIIVASLYQKNMIMVFDNDEIDSPSCPDCYIRDNNSIYLFEFKDSLMPVKIAKDLGETYDELIKDIYLKYGKEDKGVGQIIKQLEIIYNTGFDFDKIENYEKKQIKLYPIIVYTHSMYSLPGINETLVNKLNELIKNKKYRFTKIYPVVMIDIKFFMDNYDRLMSKKIKLESLIKNYRIHVKKEEIKFERKPTPYNAINQYPSFEHYSSQITVKKSKENMMNLWKLLEINVPNETINEIVL